MADATNSTELNVSDAAAAIAALDTPQAVHEFVTGDGRKGVTDAVELRLAELEDQGEPDIAPEARPGTPLRSGSTGSKLVRTRYPVNRFEHGLEGVPAITAAGVEVEARHIAELLELAAEHDTELEEVGA